MLGADAHDSGLGLAAILGGVSRGLLENSTPHDAFSTNW
jgi:hypothetical protein